MAVHQVSERVGSPVSADGSSPHTLEVVCLNLGCCGPAGASRRAWALDLLGSMGEQDGGDVLLLQEVPRATGIEQLSGRYEVFVSEAPTSPRWCLSAVAVRRGMGFEARHLGVPEGASHGSFVAAAEIHVPPLGPVGLVSVHASPTKLTDADLGLWEQDRPGAREGGDRDGGSLWHADLILESVRQLLDGRGELLVGGDWNESREWDRQRGSTWADELFAKAQSAGLSDLTLAQWGEERPTRGAFQIDHLLATEGIAGRSTRAEVGPAWPASGSDHAPISLTIDLSPRPES